MAKAKPILMNTPMVKATLEDLKKQTRRVVKIDHSWDLEEARYYLKGHPDKFFAAGFKRTNAHRDSRNVKDFRSVKSPYQPGNILYVRETWREWHSSDSECGCGGDYCTCSVKPSTPACYKADGHIIEDEDREMYGLKWHPSIHMPKWACRLFLKVTAVRVERLQQISIDDIEREGINISRCPGLSVCGNPYWICPDCERDMETANRDSFVTLWDSTTAKPGTRWADNPWVWVYEFEKCAKPEGWLKDA